MKFFTNKREKELYKEGGMYTAAIITLYSILCFGIDKALQILKIILNIP